MVGSAPPERAGAASAISETSSELGGALGIAILGSIATAVFRHQMTHGAIKAAHATLSGALAAGHRLPHPLALSLHDAARHAFTQGLEVAAMISAALLVASALLALLHLRPAGADPGLTPAPQPTAIAAEAC
jgi:DHA2 family multidrug resistance protein-like MFS transporter